MFFSSRSRFTALKQEEDSDIDEQSDNSDEKLLESGATPHFLVLSTHSRSPLTWLILLTILNGTLVAVSAFFFFSPFSKSLCQSRLTDQDYWKATSAYSPVLSRFQIPKIDVVMHGDLYDTDPPSILRIPTGKKADDEWSRIGTGIYPLVINSEEVRALEKDPATAVRIPEEHGYGSDAFIAEPDVYHYLHCLDMIRMQASYSYYNEPHFGPFPGNNSQHIAHVGHCFEILAEALKCAGSTDLITFNWREDWDRPFPDFSNKHVCRDFEAMLEWNNENAIQGNVWEALREPPHGYNRLPNPKDVQTAI